MLNLSYEVNNSNEKNKGVTDFWKWIKFSSLGKAIKSKDRHRKVNFFHIPIPKVINLFLFMILLVFQLSWSPLLSNIKVFLVHSITSFYSLFFFWTSSHTISWLIQIWAKRNDMGQKTALGSLLKSIGNSGQGKVVPGWGAVPVMAFIGVLLLVFLVIMLQIYNQSLLLQGFSVDWNG